MLVFYGVFKCFDCVYYKLSILIHRGSVFNFVNTLLTVNVIYYRKMVARPLKHLGKTLANIFSYVIIWGRSIIRFSAQLATNKNIKLSGQ